MAMFDDPRWDDARESAKERPTMGRGGADADPREPAERNPRDVFSRSLDLPRGPSREPVEWDGDVYRLRGSDVRTLATVGAFRIVPVDDLRDDHGRSASLHRGDVGHLRSLGLLEHVASVDRESGRAFLTLTERGRDLLEAHRTRDDDRPQAFHAGVGRSREMLHDAQVYRAYQQAAERLERDGAHIERIVLEQDLKREYQQFLHERNRGDADTDGRPDRTADEVRTWAEEHHLAYVDGHVQFPDVQIEVLWPDDRREVENVEVMTPHYRGAHVSGKVSAGFKTFRFTGGRVGGRTGRGSKFDPGLAEELLR